MIKNNYKDKILKFRRDLDGLAEAGWDEKRTSSYILKNLGDRPCFSEKTALVFRIGSGTPVFFRSELDALNTSSGPRHLCGHSAHMSALMGAYLNFKKEPPKGFCIYFVFQPAEEVYPSGADFISKNFPEINKCRAGFAFHVMPGIPEGEIRTSSFASGDYFEIEVTGRSVHIKDKNTGRGKDAILAGCDIARAINGNTDEEFITNVGVFQGGDLPNRIAETAILKGDARALSERGRKRARAFVESVCKMAMAPGAGGVVKADLKYYIGFPPLVGDKELTVRSGKFLEIKGENRSFGTEDFSIYKAPKVMFSMGTGSGAELHSNDFYAGDKAVIKIFESWIKIGENLADIVD